MPWKTLAPITDKQLREIQKALGGKARFLVDENAGPEVASVLNILGFNAKHVADLNLEGHPDQNVFAEAWSGRRVIVTHDLDFLNNSNFPQHRNPGVIVVRPGSDGRDDRGLIACLVMAVRIAGNTRHWFIGKKLDFTSRATLTVDADGTKTKYRWQRHGGIEVFEQ